MQKKIKLRPRYIFMAAVFSACAHVMYLSLPVYMMIIYDKVLYSFSQSTLYSLSLGLLITLLAMIVVGYLKDRILARAGDLLVEEMELFVMETMRADAAGTQPVGYTRGLADLETVRNAAAGGRLFAFMDLPWVLVYLIVVFIIHPLLGLVAMAVVFLAVVFHMLLATAEKKRYTAAEVGFDANVEFAKNCLFRARLLSGMHMLPALARLYRQRRRRADVTRSGADSLYAWIGAVIRFIQVSGPVAVFGAGVYAFFQQQITAGAIVAVLIISLRLFFVLEQRLSKMQPAIEAAAALRRLRTFVNVQPAAQKLSLPAPKGQFSAEGITLALAGKPVLYNITFDLAPGEMLGILGPSSAGKSCLCRVLLGIWRASAGKIRLDGAEINQWPEEDLAGYVGYLAEEPVLFPVTAAQNIARLREPDPEKVVAAAQKAGIHEMILTLAKGYDTMIEGSGDNLSAAQRQGLCLARALYDDPKLLILDEPHTHLDDQGLQTLLTCIDGLKHSEVTMVVVTDRPKILMKMDKLLMIKEGRPAMYGPAQEVLAQLSNRQTPTQAVGV